MTENITFPQLYWWAVKILKQWWHNADTDNAILCINVSVPIDTMLKFYENAEANVDFDAKCEQTIQIWSSQTWLFNNFLSPPFWI